MKFVVPKKDLLRAAKVAQSAAAGRSDVASLTTIVLDADEGLTLSGSDLITGARVELAADVDSPGRLLVPARAFVAAIQGLADGDVTVRIDGPRLELKSGRSRQRIAFGSAEDYPALVQCERKRLSPMPAATLLAVLTEVAHAMSTEDSRPHIAGVMLSITDGKCRALATDGSVFARRRLDCDAAPIDVFVPGKCLSALKSALESAKASTVGVEVHAGHLFLDHAGVTISARLGENQFPDLEKGIPATFAHRMVAPRTGLLECVRRVATATDAASLSVELVLQSGSLALRAESKESDASDVIDVDYAGEGITVLIRASLLSGTLAALTADEVAIEMNGPLHAVLVGAATHRDSVHVIAPTRPT